MPKKDIVVSYHMVGLKYMRKELLVPITIRGCEHLEDKSAKFCVACGKPMYIHTHHVPIYDGQKVELVDNIFNPQGLVVHGGNVVADKLTGDDNVYYVIGTAIPQFCGVPAMQSFIRSREQYVDDIELFLAKLGIKGAKGLFGVHFVLNFMEQY